MKYTFLTAMLVCSSFIHAGLRPADGLWSTSDDPAIGSGLMLTTQGGITVASVFTYDQAGNNAWYIASGQVDDDGVLEAVLRQTQNGSNILSENPEAAEFTDTNRMLRMDFSGTQIATLSIDSSTPKAMQTSHFGYYTSSTEQLLLADETKYRFPSIDGEWVIGDLESGESYILNLTNSGTGASPPSPNFSLYISSNHPSTDNWVILCPQRIQTIQPYCRVRRSNDESFPEMRIDLKDLGNQRMKIYQNSELDGAESYQAFRLNKDRRLLPNDGLWRAYDDPAIGSGMAMRTQGDYTVVLVYTYDDEGVPIWKIAAGQFNENGHFSAELLIPTGGTAIENQTPTTASFSDHIQTIEIQLQGLELATFSVDGSAPKTIQNYNFGVELFTTDHFKVNHESFAYPDQKEAWVFVDEGYQDSRISLLDTFDLNASQSPPDPRLKNARQYQDVGNDEDFSLTFFCTKILSAGDFVFELKPYCFGYHFVRPVSGPLKLYYEDIGYTEFRYYISEEFNGMDVSHIDRNSEMFYLFRLSAD